MLDRFSTITALTTEAEQNIRNLINKSTEREKNKERKRERGGERERERKRGREREREGERWGRERNLLLKLIHILVIHVAI